VKITHRTSNIAEIFMKEIARLHRIPKTIVSDKDKKFTSNLWRGLFKGIGTNINFITTYHPQTDGKEERFNRIIEDMLGMYVMDKTSKCEDTYTWLSLLGRLLTYTWFVWEDYLHLVDG
jgi:transposase InsO family protein